MGADRVRAETTDMHVREMAQCGLYQRGEGGGGGGKINLNCCIVTPAGGTREVRISPVNKPSSVAGGARA